MSETTELRLGKRGEIYTTDKIRKKTGLTPGGKAIARVEGNRLIIEPKVDMLKLLEKPRINVKPISPEDLSQLRRELAEEIGAR